MEVLIPILASGVLLNGPCRPATNPVFTLCSSKNDPAREDTVHNGRAFVRVVIAVPSAKKALSGGVAGARSLAPRIGTATAPESTITHGHHNFYFTSLGIPVMCI